MAKSVTKSAVGQVFQDKRRLHEFLTVEMEFYLPDSSNCTVDWLREIWQGNKKVSNNIFEANLLQIMLVLKQI